MHLVVLAAGLGTRFGGLKQLEPVGPRGEAIMDVLLTRAAGCGFDRAVVVVRAEIEDAITSHFTAFAPPMPWATVVQPVPVDRDRPPGTAHAVLMCRAEATGRFAVVNADDLYPRAAFAALGRHLTTSDEHGLVAFRLERSVIGDRPVSRAALTIDGDRLVEITENTTLLPATMPAGTYVSMNMWGFQPSIFEHLERAVSAFAESGSAGEVLLPDVVATMTAGGEIVRALLCEEPCIGITYAEDIAVVRRALG